ncbi:MAG: DUF2203 domain-containing protein [Gemmatimonadales bacterium]
MPPRSFSLSQANATLPLVRRIVADIISLYPEWTDLVYRYELIAAPSRPEQGESAEQVELRERIEGVARRINGFLRELEQVGCVFKGFHEGLVDFHGQLDGREILWCWKQGEERIEHWHEVDAGYAGRQAIPEVVRSA